MDSTITVHDFSAHLFWDVDLEKFDLDQYKEFIVQRVLEYGMLKDWILLKNLYGKEAIKEISLLLKDIIPVTLSFLSTIFSIEEKEFRCYTPIKSELNFWNS